MDFNDYWQLIGGDVKFSDRKTATENLWAQHPEKHEAIIGWLKKHGQYPGRNPYFFILDWQQKRNIRQPEFLRGDEGGDLVQVRYNGRYKICTRETMELFNLEFVKNW